MNVTFSVLAIGSVLVAASVIGGAVAVTSVVTAAVTGASVNVASTVLINTMRNESTSWNEIQSAAIQGAVGAVCSGPYAPVGVCVATAFTEWYINEEPFQVAIAAGVLDACTSCLPIGSLGGSMLDIVDMKIIITPQNWNALGFMLDEEIMLLCTMSADLLLVDPSSSEKKKHTDPKTRGVTLSSGGMHSTLCIR